MTSAWTPSAVALAFTVFLLALPGAPGQAQPQAEQERKGEAPLLDLDVVTAPPSYPLKPGAVRRIDRRRGIIEREYTPTGRLRRCISLPRFRGSDALSDDYVWFTLRGSKGYITQLSQGCQLLAQNDRFIYKTPLTMLCRGDIITAVDDFGVPTGSCAVGHFVEYQRIVPGGATR